jgi:hypothetical protein
MNASPSYDLLLDEMPCSSPTVAVLRDPLLPKLLSEKLSVAETH